MKPEHESRRIFAITRSKGKMYEFGIDESAHIQIPPSVTPGELLLLAVGILGDVAASLNDGSEAEVAKSSDVQFAASFFDAYLASTLDTDDVENQIQLLASAAYYLADRPGSSLVIARRIRSHPEETAAEVFVRWLLQAKWEEPLSFSDEFFGDRLQDLAGSVAQYFATGQGKESIGRQVTILRQTAYRAASPWNLLLIDVAAALIELRIRTSSWQNLPNFMGLSAQDLIQTIQKPGFPKELWPSQMLLGREGLFQGKS